MQRPVGLTIIAILAIILGIFDLLLAFLGLVGIGLKSSGLSSTAVSYSVGTLVYAIISDAILGALALAFGIGAFRLKRWALATGVVTIALNIVRDIVSVVVQGFGTLSVIRAIITIIIALAILWYLLRPHVRAALQAGQVTTPSPV
jgi:hypothetical protein